MKEKYKAVYSSVILLTLVLLCVWAVNRGLTENVREFVREDTLLAVSLALSLYALKSFIPIVPLPVLYLATAHIFESATVALLVNIAGIAISQTFPYLLGRTDGKRTLMRLAERSDIVKRSVHSIMRRPFLATFISRLSPIIPKDIISLVSGIIRVPYRVYIVSSVLGSLPGLASVTILGRNIDRPSSPIFFLSLLFAVSTTAVSYIIYKRTEI